MIDTLLALLFHPRPLLAVSRNGIAGWFGTGMKDNQEGNGMHDYK
jgi:hypothetical protein